MESRAESLEVLVLCASPVGELVTLKLAHELVQFEKELRNAQVPVRLKRVFPPTIEQLPFLACPYSTHIRWAPKRG